MLESLLDRIRKGEMALTAQHVDAFLAAKDILKMQLDGHRNGADVDGEEVANVRMMLHELSEGVIVPAHQPTVPSFLHAEQKQEVREGAHRYKIELPELPKRDVDALVDELGLLGRVSVTPLPAGRTALIIMTMESIEAVIRHAHQQGLQRYVTVTTVAIERMLRRAGVVITRIGAPQQVGIERAVALYVEIEPTWDALYARSLAPRPLAS